MRSHDLHDQRHVVVDQEHAGAVLAARPSGRARRSPAPPPRAARRPARRAARTAARSRARARRRAAARRRARARARRVGVAVEPEPLEQRVGAPRRASRGAAPTPSADDLDVLAHRQRRGTRGCAETCGQARAARADAATSASRRCPPSCDRAGVRPVEAAEDVDERRLAGAVRADQPDDLATPSVERDAAQAPARLRRSVTRRRPGASLRASSPTPICASSRQASRSSGRPWRRPCRRASACCSGS